jgi:Na+/melibiose symporter-like transporter
MQTGMQRLSIGEKVGYSCADAAANFVFMTMILFQKNFYTDVFGLAAGTAAAILLAARLWDAVVDPIVGTLSDRTKTRWGKFRPWILFTALPWCIVMVLAYSTPQGWSTNQMIAYAAITNILLMSIYSMNNMPYSALGGVMTADVNERAKLNSYRFVAVNAAQFIVGGFTLPLVAKFAAEHAAGGKVQVVDTQHGWQVTMTIWAVACLVLFLITFLTTRERIQPNPKQQVQASTDPFEAMSKRNWRIALPVVIAVSALFIWASWRFLGVPFALVFTPICMMVSLLRLILVVALLFTLWKSLTLPVQQDFRDLSRNAPWVVMFAMTLVHFCILSFRGGALYDYYTHYADKAAMYDWVSSLHLNLTKPPLALGEKPTGFVDGVLGYVVHADKSNVASSNVAGVAYSLINMMNTATIIIFIILTASFAKRFGKKAVAVTGFGLSTLTSLAFYWLSPTNIWGMVALTLLTAIAYAPTIALVWAIYADVADYSEWKTGRRFTGIVFATIGFALKSGLAIGAASELWILTGFFHYDTKLPDASEAIRGYRICSSLLVGGLFAICTILLICYPLGKRITIQMADELAERRKQFAAS